MIKQTLNEFLENKKLGKVQFIIILGDREWKRYSLDAEGQKEMDDLSETLLIVDLDRNFKASNASRRMRELAESGQVLRKEEKGSVWYKFKPLVPAKEKDKKVNMGQHKLL